MNTEEILAKHRERWVRDQLVLMECRFVAEAGEDETLLQAITRMREDLHAVNEMERLRAGLAEMEESRAGKFNAYKIPIGTEFVLGKRRWCLVERMKFHPDFLTFREVSQSPHTPDRVYNPSEIEAMHKLGVVFTYPAVCDDCGAPKPRGVCQDCHPEVEIRGPFVP